MTTQPKKRGRKRRFVYKPEFAALAEKVCALGATLAELAEFFDVTPRSVTWWERRRPAFARAVQIGRARAKERVERSLFQRSVGYTFEGVTVVSSKDGRKPVQLRYQEHVPADPYAAAIWLKRNDPEQRREPREPRVPREPRQRTHQSGAGSEPVPEFEKTIVILPPNGRD
jgi:hypothetical protein